MTASPGEHSTEASVATESALAQLRTLLTMATKLAETEDRIAVAMTDAASMLPHRADRLMAIASAARTSATAWRAWAADGGSELKAVRRGVETTDLAERGRELRSRAAELRAQRGGSGPDRLISAQRRLETAIADLHDVRLRCINALDASAAAHDRAAASFQQAVDAHVARNDYAQRALEHRAAAAADRDRAKSARALLE